MHGLIVVCLISRPLIARHDKVARKSRLLSLICILYDIDIKQKN